MAALYVVIHHSVSSSTTLFGLNIALMFRFGEEAVILFFLLSGFVINFSFVKTKDKTFQTYFFKRATRIYIPLLIVMVLGYFMECYEAGEVVNAQPRELLLNLLMLQDISSLKPNVVVDPYMHNSPLWSLSYEWWFYMLYFQVQKHISSSNRKDMFVFGLAIVSALTYVYFPVFLPRLLMYMGIWWLGVILSNKYMKNDEITLQSLAMPLAGIVVVFLICGFGVYRASLSGTLRGMGVHPVLEMRDHFSALMIVAVGVFWKSKGWIFFDRMVRPFLIFAPISYVVYISHYYFVVRAHYFSFMTNQALEFMAYVMLMLAFSYIVEIIIYPKILKGFSGVLRAPVRVT
ncbi:acyltransferase family protein [Polaromonas sp. CG9_12]|nr:acyltransferase family protein [Polaromonas sp. CG9_12]